MALTSQQAMNYLDEYLVKVHPNASWGPAHAIVEDGNMSRSEVERALSWLNSAILYRAAIDSGFSQQTASETATLLLDRDSSNFMVHMHFYMGMTYSQDKCEELETLVATKIALERSIEWLGDAGDFEDGE